MHGPVERADYDGVWVGHHHAECGMVALECRRGCVRLEVPGPDRPVAEAVATVVASEHCAWRGTTGRNGPMAVGGDENRRHGSRVGVEGLAMLACWSVPQHHGEVVTVAREPAGSAG